ncbi:hypothetical protein D3C80_786860 [compost metagenome]
MGECGNSCIADRFSMHRYRNLHGCNFNRLHNGRLRDWGNNGGRHNWWHRCDRRANHILGHGLLKSSDSHRLGFCDLRNLGRRGLWSGCLGTTVDIRQIFATAPNEFNLRGTGKAYICPQREMRLPCSVRIR